MPHLAARLGIAEEAFVPLLLAVEARRRDFREYRIVDARLARIRSRRFVLDRY